MNLLANRPKCDLSRRRFLRSLGQASVAGVLLPQLLRELRAEKPSSRPNIILCMTDDQGWGDTGYNGHPILKTPVLDEMVAQGIRFNRFYAQAPVCSPTRGSCLTGRHPDRYRCLLYNCELPLREVTVAKAVKTVGYATGHFGKWHLGGLDYTHPEKLYNGGIGVPPEADPLPRNPGNHGFDEWFSARNFYDLDPSDLVHNGKPCGPLKGEPSTLAMEKAIEFIRKQHAQKKPFLAVIWFPSPHSPYRALPEDMAPYGAGEKAAYLGELAAVDRNMGALRKELRALGIAGNTMIWFCSDNGAVGNAPAGANNDLRGTKATLMEGGIRVPGILEWPDKITKPFQTDVPACTSDYYPTILAMLGIQEAPQQPQPIDGINLLPLIEGTMKERPKPIGFSCRSPGNDQEPVQAAWMDNQWKIIKGCADLPHGRGQWHLFNLATDRQEKNDLSAKHPEVLERMKQQFDKWNASVVADMKKYPSKKPKSAEKKEPNP